MVEMLEIFTKLIESPIIIPFASIKTRTIPQMFLNQVPKSVAKRISETLPSEEILTSSIKIKAIKENGFTHDLTYSTNEAQQLENNEEMKHKERFGSTHHIQKK